MKRQRWYIPVGFWLIFESIAVILWLTKEQVFYLFNFSYIGTVLAVGLLLFQRNYRYARHMVQLLVGLYMLVYLGLICGENMQIEGFWYYLFTGVFEAATIHYAVAKILFLEEAGAAMLVGLPWFWIFFPIKFPRPPVIKNGKSYVMSHLEYH